MSARALSAGDARMLFGRDKVLEFRAFVEESSCDGHPLLLSGSPGVGKTVLLDVQADWLRCVRSGGARRPLVSFQGLRASPA